MRERLKAFLKSAEKSADALETEGLVVAASYLLGCAQAVQHILDTEQPDGSVQPQWVPVTERLPDEFVDVIAWDGERVRLAYRRDGQWVRNDGFILRGVTHWHEIDYPEPPEVQQ